MTGTRWFFLPAVLLLLLARPSLQITMPKLANTTSTTGVPSSHPVITDITDYITSTTGTPNTVEVNATSPEPKTIIVQWTLSNTTISDQVTSYVISWIGEGEGEAEMDSVNSSITTYNITGLVPCSTYIITVQPNDFMGVSGSSIATTETQEPTPVSNVTLTPVSDNSHQLDVSWTLSMDIGRCPGYYNVTWNGTKEGEAEVQNTTRYNITNLDSWTLYNVCVDSDKEQNTLNNTAKCEDGRTDEDVPDGAPENIKTVTTTTNSLTVEWDPPAVPNGVITNYSVTWSPDDGIADTTDTTYTITGLLPCTNYTVTLSAATSKGYGPSDNTIDTTQPVAPGPPTNVTVDIVPNQSDSLNVNWTQAEPSDKCDITNNIVTWWLSSNGIQVDNVTVNPTDHYIISGLDPWTTYLVCVRAATQGFDGPNAPCLTQTTDEDIPSDPPENIRVVTTTTESIELKWDPPAAPNGVIINYLVTWSQDTTDTTDTTYNLTGLLPCTIYTVTVSAATSKGYGPSGDTSNTTQAVAPPLPDKITCTATEATVLTTTWSTPTTTCNITQYKVNYEGHILWLNSTKVNSSSVDSPQNSINLTGLVPWTLYTVCVRAEIIGGLVGDQSCCFATTEQTAPGPPTSLNQIGSSTKSVSMAWTQPEELNGRLSGYCLTWELGQKNLTQSDNTTTIGGLKEGTTYNVTLQAMTNRIHLGKAMQQDMSTKNMPVGGIVGGVIVGLVLVAAAGAAYVYRDRLKTGMRKHHTSRSSNPSVGFSFASGVSRRPSAPPPRPPKPSALQLTPLPNWSEGVIGKNEISRYIQYLEEDTQRGLEEEYALLKDLSPQYSIYAATRDFNKPKNRFINILAYDHTRVKLPLLPANPGSDYINASYIVDMHNDYFFVASQGPKPITIDDFWRMVWELKVYTIVMLTNLKEKGKDKCAQYWPSSSELPLRFGSITVSNQMEEDGDYHVVRYLVLDMGDKKRVVKQYHFTTWPDFGVPSHEHNLLNFMKVVRDSMTTSSKHIVVHCSAGVGRTGTFIGLWNLVDTVEGETAAKTVNVRRAVLNMRECRPSMVQSQDQYLYLWKCLAAYVDNPQRWKPKDIGDDHVYDNAAYDPIYDNLGPLSKSEKKNKGE